MGRGDAATMALLELGDAAGVIRVVMSDEDVAESPAGRLQRGLDRRGLGRIDRRGGAALGIVQEDAEIILEAKKQTGLRGHVVLRIRSAQLPSLGTPRTWPASHLARPSMQGCF